MKTKNLFLLAALAVSGILHAESVDIPVLYRNPAEEVKTGQLQSFGFYENETRIVLAFQIKDLKKVMEDPKRALSFYADTDDDLMTGRYPKNLGWDFQINVMLKRKSVVMMKWNGNKAENLPVKGKYAVSSDGDVLYITFLKSAVPGIEFRQQFKFRALQLRNNQRVDKKKSDEVFAEKFVIPADK